MNMFKWYFFFFALFFVFEAQTSFALGFRYLGVPEDSVSDLVEASERVNFESGPLQEEIFSREDLNVKVFGDYIEPNEIGVTAIRKHLNKMEKGILVSAGTERSFFDLILCRKCTGLVVRDLNPRVKAYVDFNVLLLKISRNLQDYNEISSRSLGRAEYRALIEGRILDSQHLSPAAQRYYLDQLDNLIRNYRRGGGWQKIRAFNDVNYHIHPRLFRKLQAYARSGSIIATIGNINDLRFLDAYPITAIDSSNICDYTLLDFQLKENSRPLAIWTKLHPDYTSYESDFFDPLDNLQREEFDEILNEWMEFGALRSERRPHLEATVSKALSSGESFGIRTPEFTLFPGYSQKTLEVVKKVDSLFIEDPGIFDTLLWAYVRS